MFAIITNPEEMKPFLGTNYLMAVNQFPIISMHRDCVHFISNNGVQNILQEVDTRRS